MNECSDLTAVPTAVQSYHKTPCRRRRRPGVLALDDHLVPPVLHRFDAARAPVLLVLIPVVHLVPLQVGRLGSVSA